MAAATVWPERPKKLAGDKAVSAGWVREWLTERGIEPVLAPQQTEKARAGSSTARATGGGTSSSAVSAA